jgi:hypothetical protein
MRSIKSPVIHQRPSRCPGAGTQAEPKDRTAKEITIRQRGERKRENEI